MEALNTFIGGALTALCAVAGVVFLRYWRTSRDRFFVFVALTCGSLGVNWASLVLTDTTEHHAYFYLSRLFAFVVLLVGIADKNRRR